MAQQAKTVVEHTCYYYPLVDDKITCFAAQSVSDEELDDIEGELDELFWLRQEEMGCSH